MPTTTSSGTWYSYPGEVILVGDYESDSRDDLLCYAKRGFANAGRERIDIVGASGWFYGTDFTTENHSTAAQTWGTNTGESIYVIDFNGGGKDDLLCRVEFGWANAERRRLDFANNLGCMSIRRSKSIK